MILTALVSAEILAQHLADPDWIIFDCRHDLPDPDALMEKLGRAGVDSRKQVVAYDAQGGMVAARLWWLLRWLGHLPVAVLDGGWNQWISEGRAQTAEVPQPQPTRFS